LQTAACTANHLELTYNRLDYSEMSKQKASHENDWLFVVLIIVSN